MWSRPLVPALGYKITKNSPAIVYSGDASGDNMTATAHLVTELQDDDPDKKNGVVNHVALIKAMGRLVPLAGMTIPRAELAASHLCTILSTAMPLELSIPISRHLYFTDSQTALAQLRSRQSLYEPWVLVRLRCINAKTKYTDWYKVDGLRTAADIPSKIHTKSLPELIGSKLWQKGDFLEQGIETWPITQPPAPKTLHKIPGVLPKYAHFENLFLSNLQIQEAMDDAANTHEEEELVDLGLDYTPNDMHINFPTLTLRQLNFQAHIKTGKDSSQAKADRKFPTNKLCLLYTSPSPRDS